MQTGFFQRLRLALFIAFGLFVTAFGTGCGALAAATNPKVSWALNDPAPMTVVVRRADVAEDTGKQVDRLMMSTPIDADASWIAKTAPSAEDAKTQAEEIAKQEMYATTGTRVVQAEVWSKALASIEAPKPATLTAAEVPKPPAKPTNAKGSKKGTKEPKVAPPPPPPPPAPAPKYTSLIAAIDAELGEKYGRAVLQKKRQIGEIEAQIAQEKAALDDKNTSDADKTAKKAHIEELEKNAETGRAEAKNLEKELVTAVGASAAKASPEVREKFGVAFVNLRQAVEDARIANDAASLRYPFALPTLVQSAEQMVHVYVADVIEEKTGKRPETRGLQPGVSLEGGKVQITLNGLSASEMGKLSVGEVTSEVAKRTQAWVARALGLLSELSANKEILQFEQDVLDSVLNAFKTAGWTAPAPPQLPFVTPPQPPAHAKKSS